MKKLYFIRANTTKFGGAENYLRRLCDELQQKNIDYNVINSKMPKILFSWLRAFVFSLQVCMQKSKNDCYFSLERITCPDIYRAGDGVHKVFLTTKRRTFNPLNVVYLYLERKCFTNAKQIIANSHMIKEQIVETYHIQPEKISVIYNGIALSKQIDYKSSLNKISDEYPAILNKKVILFVGSGFERKGVKEFLSILATLQTKTYHAFVIGKEKNLPMYKKLAHSLKVEEHVTFTGPRSDVNDFYAISDIFLFPTHYEPFSNVVLEAMNYKNVVITTRQNGAHEILNESYIMDNPNDFSIGSMIDNLFNNPLELEKAKNENYEIVQQFSIEKNAQKTMEIIHAHLH